MATSSKGAEDVAPQAPRVHAIVLTWNGAHLLPRCLRSILAQDAGARVRVVVVDNASTDGTTALLEREFPEVERLSMPENLGFGIHLRRRR